MHSTGETTALPRQGFGRPELIFFSELDSSALRELIESPGLLAEIVAGGYSIAIATRELGQADAALIRLLNRSGIAVIAWLLLPAGEGLWLNLQNYPQAIERYRAFQTWARREQLHVTAIGLDIEPPAGDLSRLQRWGMQAIARRLWLASENVLFPAARAAYTDLIAEIHHDGYEVHTYQLPILADDRRAGTTLAQRALDIVDLPADVEVLICYSSAPLARLGNDFGGALIRSYGLAADAIGVGSLAGSSVVDSSAVGLPPLSWEALERDLLLAAHHTDTIYIFSLEGCVERGLLSRIRQLNWDQDTRAVPWKHALVVFVRSLIFAGLMFARFSRGLLAWLGWGVAALLLIRQLRGQRRPPPGAGSSSA